MGLNIEQQDWGYSNISEHHNWCWTHEFHLLFLEMSPKSLKWKANKIALVFNLYFNITFEYLKSIIFTICLIKFSLKLLPLDLHRISSVTNLQAATRNKIPGIPTINLWSRIIECSNNKDSLRSKLFSDSQYKKNNSAVSMQKIQVTVWKQVNFPSPSFLFWQLS